jgi:hypothetical protein
MKKEIILKIASIIIGTIMFILLVYFGFRIFGSQAGDFQPREVVISNITQNSVTITWVTGVETQGVIEYGTTPTALNFFAPESTKTKNHSVDLTLLSPSTTYYFQIRINDRKYDNGGVPWTFTTKAVEKTATPSPFENIPSPTPTISVNTPTPVQRLIVPTESSSSLTCDETDCAKIKEKLGKGCTTQDYFKCILKSTPTATPTATLTPTPTP